MSPNEWESVAKEALERSAWNERRIELMEKSMNELFEEVEQCRHALKILAEKMKGTEEEEEE